MKQDSNKFTIKIESILGGHSSYTHFAGADQFQSSLGIDPSAPSVGDATSKFSKKSSGLLRPTSTQIISSSLAGPGLWLELTPKDENVYVYDAAGSVYSLNTSLVLSGIGDLNDGGSASGNGCAYYDNYLYASRDTTVARYGPLDGTPAWTDDYWVGTLGKTALVNTTYPQLPFLSGQPKFPNHVLHRHSDGRLYIADVVNNQGTIHFIQTTKTTAEGDTDNGSTYNKVQVGYGLWPTAMETYGDSLVIAFSEGNSSTGTRKKNAKVAFWDTTSQNVNQIIWVEYPDPFIGAIKNVNGELRFFSGNLPSSVSYGGSNGLRILRYIGGNSFEEVFQLGGSSIIFPHGVDSVGNRMAFTGAHHALIDSFVAAQVYTMGLFGKNDYRLFSPQSLQSTTYYLISSVATKFYSQSNITYPGLLTTASEAQPE